MKKRITIENRIVIEELLRMNFKLKDCLLYTSYDMEGRKIHVRGREELAICFQHELDHLNGILFTDHIDKKNPFIFCYVTYR